MHDENPPKLISERIRPIEGTTDVQGMARGGPGLPIRFTWRKKEYTVAQALAQWTETGPCTHGSDEKYVRKHWFRIQTVDGTEMTLYFERQARSSRQRKSRWWLYSIAR